MFIAFGVRSPSTRREGVMDGLYEVAMDALCGVVALISYCDLSNVETRCDEVNDARRLRCCDPGQDSRNRE